VEGRQALCVFQLRKRAFAVSRLHCASAAPRRQILAPVAVDKDIAAKNSSLLGPMGVVKCESAV